MKASIARLLYGTLLAWALVFWPARWLWGAEVMAQSLTGCLLCLAPAVLTLAWAQRVLGGKPEEQLAAVFGGMLLRMVVVLAGGIALFFAVPVLHSAAFWMWILGFYLLTLILEIALILTASPHGGEPVSRSAEQPRPAPKGQPAADTLSP